MNDYARNIGETVARLRKEKGLTQEALADRLGVTYQAVSKWENCASCPDISLLPGLAEVFGVTLDALFGVVRPAACLPTVQPAADGDPENDAATEEAPFTEKLLPWEDDGVLRVVVFEGRTLLDAAPADLQELEFTYVGEAKNVQSVLNLTVLCQPAGRWDANGKHTRGGVSGDVNAGGSVNCGDIDGGVTVTGSLSCGDVNGSVTAGGNVSCGDVGDFVQAKGATVSCGDVGGSVTCGELRGCGDIDGDLTVTGSLSCGDVNGSVTAGGNVSCGDVGDFVQANGATVSCGDIGGGLTCAEVKRCGDVEGGIHYQK